MLLSIYDVEITVVLHHSLQLIQAKPFSGKPAFMHQLQQVTMALCPVSCRNEPHVHVHREESNLLKWHGAELSVTILGNWQYYRAKVLRYMRQIAVITPYAQFTFQYKAEDEKNSVNVTFVRRTDKMPPPPKASWPILLTIVMC